jgi:hypothetical protein
VDMAPRSRAYAEYHWGSQNSGAEPGQAGLLARVTVGGRPAWRCGPSHLPRDTQSPPAPSRQPDIEKQLCSYEFGSVQGAGSISRYLGVVGHIN